MELTEYSNSLADRLQSAVGGKATDGWVDGYREAMSAYLGELYGNEVQGRSQVVSRDVAEVIDGSMPSFMRTFMGGARVVEFQPTAADDEDAADEATELVNHFWSVKNNGFTNTYTWIKDSLLNGVGVIKVWYQEEIIEPARREAVDVAAAQAMGLDVDESGTVLVSAEKKRRTIKIEPIPPQEVRVSNRGGSSIDDVDFVAHVKLVTRSELLKLGVTEEQLGKIDWDADLFDVVPDSNAEESAIANSYRVGYNVNSVGSHSLTSDLIDDEALQFCLLVDASVLIDQDGDGIAERRRIIWAGREANVILYDEPTEMVHFELLSPILMPHCLIGNSLAGQVLDIQLIKTGLFRNGLDNVAQQVNPRRQGVVGQFNIDDATNPEIGVIERVQSIGALVDMPSPNIVGEVNSLLEAADGVRESRTGMRKFSSMLDGRGQNAYSETAFGAGLVENAANDRLDLITRTFAETGFRGVFKKILRLIVEHWDEPLSIRLRGKPTTIDPRKFDIDMDIMPTVGLGVNGKQQKIAEADGMLAIAEKVITMQGGLMGAFIGEKEAYNFLKASLVARGEKVVSNFIKDPGAQEQQQPVAPPPDPKLQELQMKMQLEQAKMKQDADLKREQMQAEISLKREQMLAEMQLKREQMMLGSNGGVNVGNVRMGGQVG